MTKDFPTPPPLVPSNRGPDVSPFGFFHSLVIGASAFGIRVYQLTISPAQAFLFGASGGCRFTPTCSQFAREAVRAHGVLTGGALAVRRICRCHPWGDCGHDPVPEKRKTETGNIFHPLHS